MKYLSVFSLNAGKYGPENTPYLDTFHGVLSAKKKKSKKSSLASSKSRQRNYLQAEQFEAQQREGRLEEKVNYCEREYEATTTKLQRKFRKKDLL